MPVKMTPPALAAAVDELLTQNFAEAIDAAHLRERLLSGDPLRIKLGLDTNKPDLHLGHAVVLTKLRRLQELGHQAVIILGDYTATLGDPSDKQQARTLIDPQETKANAELVKRQILKLLDPDRTEFHYNSQWLAALDLRQLTEIVSKVSVNHLLSHQTFADRLASQQPLLVHELIYPILQGYDSVQIKADLELGGIDQKFNCLMGRLMQRAYEQPTQDILLVPYLAGIDGQSKMSKSLGNTINLTDSAEQMFGKAMSIPDAQIINYFELATLVPESAIDRWRQELANPEFNPKEAKLALAQAITSLYHGLEAAQQAESAFIDRFQKKLLPTDLPELKIAGHYPTVILALMASEQLESNAAARRLIEQGGVKLDQQTLDQPLSPITLKVGQTLTLGKRRAYQIVSKER